MKVVTEEARKHIDKMVDDGRKLYYALRYQTMSEEQKEDCEKEYKENRIDVLKLPCFNIYYEIWYSEALLVVKKFIPD